MILRRITEHVKAQNWFAVGLDFFIVVAGILIAFQITNWNGARQDRRDEQRFLAELAVNLEADIAEMREGRTDALDRLGIAETILAEVEPGRGRVAFFGAIDHDLAPLGGFEGYPYASLTESFTLVSADSTYLELVQTGRLAVIRNRSLVKNLTAYYDRLDHQRGDDDPLLTQTEAMLSWLRENGLGVADPASLDDAIARAMSEEAFLGFVKMAGFLGHWQYSRLVRIEAEAQTLLEAVRAELENG